MTPRRRCLWPVLALLGLAACGGGGGGAPTGPTTPTPGVTTLSGTVGAYSIVAHDFTPSQAGTITASLTWTSTADLDLYVTAATCTGYPPDSCVVLARGTTSSGQREEVTLTVTSTAVLKVWIDNFHPTQAVPYSVAVTVR